MLFNKVMVLTSSNDMKSIHTGFTIFHVILKGLSWFGVIGSGHRDLFLDKMQPKMLVVAEELVSHDSKEAGDLIKLTIKTYFTLMNKSSSSRSMFLSENLLRWCKVFTAVISKKLSRIIPVDEMESSSWWKAVKWSYKCVDFLMTRSNDANDTSVEERKLFRNHYAVEIYKVVDEQIKALMGGMPVTRKVKQQMAIFLISCVYLKSTWIMLKPNVMNIVSLFILPIVSFDAELEDLWSTNPTEYILESLECTMGEYFGPRSATLRFLQILSKERYAHVFIHLMSYLTQMLSMDCNADQSPGAAERKYGFYTMASVLVPLALNKNSPVKGEMEQFATTIILPDMKSNYPFIRQAACDVFSKLETLTWKNEKDLIFAVESILENLAHPEIQVSVFASFALRSVLCNEIVMDYIRPKVHGIVQILQTLNNAMDLDEISDTIEIIAARFYTELMPFITSLVKNLVDSIMNSVSGYNEAADDALDGSDFVDGNYDIVTVVQSHLRIIITYIMIMKEYPQVVAEVDAIVAPAIRMLFDKNIIDVYGDAFETLEVLAYCSKSISPNLWGFMPTVINIVLSDPEEHIETALNLLDHYVDYGRPTFAMSPDHRTKMYDVIKAILTQDSYTTSGSSKIRACELIESLALNLRNETIEAIPFFLELILPHIMKMNNKTTSSFLVFALEVVINMIYCSPRAALSYLDAYNAMPYFFMLWFDTLHKFKRVHDKKLCILAISEILVTPPELLPEALNEKNTFRKLIQALALLLGDYPKALIEYEKEKRKNSDECESDDQNGPDDSTLGGQSDGDIQKDIADDYPFNEYDDDDEEEDDDEWYADELSEDVYFVTEITKIDPYAVTKATIQSPYAAARLNEHLTDEERLKLVNVIEVGEMMASKSSGAPVS